MHENSPFYFEDLAYRCRQTAEELDFDIGVSKSHGKSHVGLFAKKLPYLVGVEIKNFKSWELLMEWLNGYSQHKFEASLK